MSHQHRLGNWNENSNPIRDARARRNTIFINSAGNSSVGFNNRTRGSRTTTNQLVPELNIHLPPRHHRGNSSTTINHGGDHHHYPPTRVLPTTITTTTTTSSTMNGDLGRIKRSRSTRGESSDQGSQDGGISSRRRTIPPPFYPHQDNVNNMSSQTQMNSAITTQTQMNRPPRDPTGLFEHDDPIPYNNSSRCDFPTRPLETIIALGHQEDPSTNFPRGRHDPSPTSALSLYPSAATGGASVSSSRGTSLGQNGDNNNNFEFFDTTIRQGTSDAYDESTINVQQVAMILPEGRVNGLLAQTTIPVRPSSSVPPPLTTSDPSPSNYILNPSPPPPGPEFTTDVQTDQNIQTDSGLPRSENVALPGGNNRSFSTSQELMAERNWLRDEMSSSQQRLSNGGSLRTLDWMLLDYSILLNQLIDSQERLEQIYNSEDNSMVDWMYELFETGLTEQRLTGQEILRCIHQEIYSSRLEETSTMNQTCTICQEDYVEGEKIGRLDCMHLFHLDCIKQWLERKNVCPICKQPALEIDEDES